MCVCVCPLGVVVGVTSCLWVCAALVVVVWKLLRMCLCVCVCVKRQNVGRLAGVVVLVVLVVVAVFASLCFLALSRCLYLL